MIRERATTFVDAADRLDFVFRDPPAVDAEAAAKFLVPDSAALLREAGGHALEASSRGRRAGHRAARQRVAAERGLAIKDVAQPARVALTGQDGEPGPLRGHGRPRQRALAGAPHSRYVSARGT